MIKRFIKKFIDIKSKILIGILSKSKVGRYFLSRYSRNIINQTKFVAGKNIKMSFYVPNEINRFRVNTFFDKEPETLKWIDNFQKNSVFYDIGANIGLYSCYASKKNHCKTYAFEPSYFNLELLSKNIYLNDLSDQVIIIPISLSSEKKISKFNMSSTEWGGALSTFDKKFTYDGSELKTVFSYSTMSMSLDECINFFKFPQPDHIKIDVDGIEHLILSGSMKVLQSTKSILIEINENFLENKEKCVEHLKKSGLKFLNKTSLDYSNKGNYEGCYNQIWIRD